MDTTENAIPNSQTADNAAGQNGAMPPQRVTGMDLEAALSRMNPPAMTETGDSPTSGAQPDPETTEAQPAAEETGETDLPAETTPEGELPEGETETVLSKDDEAAWGRLTPAMRERVAAVARELEGGRIKPGEIPRISQLLAERHEMADTIATLQRERDEAVNNRSETATPEAAADMPPEVGRLKTLGEVKARQVQAGRIVRQVEKLLLQFPNGNVPGDEAWAIGDKTFTREQLTNNWEVLKSELDALPERAEQIQRQSQTQTQLAQLNAVARENHPWLADPDNPETKAVRQILKANPGMAELNAAAFVRGMKSLEKEMQARKTAPNRTSAPATRPAGVVAAAKPHVSGGSAAPKGSSMKAFQSALPKPGSKVKGADLERILAALPQ